jgi:hypothetical protein
MTTPFDPAQFLDMQVTDSNDTKVVPVPVGEYTAFVSDVKTRTWAKGDKSGVALDVVWDIDNEAVKQLLARDKVTVKQGVMLDMNDTGGLAMGKGMNVGLGRLREALDLNQPGKPFALSMLSGRSAKIVVSHRVNGEDVYAEVKAVARIS